MDVMKIYLAQIKDIPVLSSGEVTKLARRIQRGLPKVKPKGVSATPLMGMTKDAQAACHKLVYHNLRLIPLAVKKHAEKFNFTLEDLMQEGTVALYNAARCYDPERCIRFSTYAVNSIRNFTLRVVHEKELLIHVPQGERIKRDEDRSEFANRALENFLSLNFRYTDNVDSYHGSKGGCTLQLTADETFDPAYIEDPFGIPTAKLHAAIAKLPPRERFIINHRYGFKGPRQTLRQIGWVMGITKERVRQLEVAATKRLRKLLVPPPQVAQPLAS